MLISNDTKSPEFLKLLSHDLRWQLLKLLAKSDMRVQELVQLLEQPQNLISYHIQKLRDRHLIQEHRSIADAREIYYSLNLDHFKSLFLSSGAALHPAFSRLEALCPDYPVDLKPARVLFLCTHNSARSQMAEGILRARSKGRLGVYSAGTEPVGIHPFAIQAMSEKNIDIQRQQSKNLDQYLSQKFDYIITVCDRAREACPVFPGDPIQIHWSLPDPLEIQGTEADRLRAFEDVARQLEGRINYLLLRIELDQKQEEAEMT